MTIAVPPVQPASYDIPADIPDLSGAAQPPGRVFFAPPPPEIGALFRAESSLKAGKRPFSPAVKWTIRALCTLPGIAIILLNLMSNANDTGPLYIVGLIVALVGFLIGFAFTRFKVSCAYVGELGAIRYTLKGRLDVPPRVEMILFESATELRTSTTRNYVNGVYTGTSYSYTWTDAAGRRVLVLSGSHNGNKKAPKAGDAFHFATATEITWTMFLLGNRADAELAESGSLRFNIDKNKFVILGPGFIEFHFSGRTDRCEAADIKSISLSQGAFSIQHRDAKWYSSKGKFSFPYGNMANARVFLMALDRFLPPSTWATGK